MYGGRTYIFHQIIDKKLVSFVFVPAQTLLSIIGFFRNEMKLYNEQREEIR